MFSKTQNLYVSWILKITQFALASVAQMVRASSHKPKCCASDSWSGHMPRFQVQSPVRALPGQGRMRGNRSMFLTSAFFSLSLSLPSPLSKTNEHVLRWRGKKEGREGGREGGENVEGERKGRKGKKITQFHTRCARLSSEKPSVSPWPAQLLSSLDWESPSKLQKHLPGPRDLLWSWAKSVQCSWFPWRAALIWNISEHKREESREVSGTQARSGEEFGGERQQRKREQEKTMVKGKRERQSRAW